VSDRVAGVAASPGHTETFVDAGGFQALERLQSGDVSALNDLPATAAAGQQPNGSGFWLTPQAGFGQVDGTADVIGTEYDFGGVAGGYDRWLSPALLLGAGLSYGALSADEIDVESTDLSVYGRWLFNDQGYVTASVFAGVHESDSQRMVNVGTDRSVARADFGADTRGAYLESGYELDAWSTGQLTPFVGLNYGHLHREGFSERGAGQANLQLEADTQESIRTLIGLKARHSFASGKAREWSADAEVAWVRELADGRSSLGAAFAAAPEFGFQVAGPEFDRSRAKVELGVSTGLSARSSLRVGYQGEIAESDQYHGALATLSLRW
jgi:outer membrane autotransporter protein